MNKSFGEKVLGIFVERDESRLTSSVASDSVSSPPARRTQAAQSAPARSSADARGTDVERAIAMVESLPADAPLETQRAIAMAALRAFGIATEDIVAAADGELAQVQEAIDEARRRHSEITRDGQASIERLRAKIAEMETLLTSQRTALVAAEEEARAKVARVRRMRAFFSA